MEKELPKNWLKIGDKYVFSDVEWGGTGLTFVTDKIHYANNVEDHDILPEHKDFFKLFDSAWVTYGQYIKNKTGNYLFHITDPKLATHMVVRSNSKEPGLELYNPIVRKVWRSHFNNDVFYRYMVKIDVEKLELTIDNL